MERQRDRETPEVVLHSLCNFPLADGYRKQESGSLGMVICVLNSVSHSLDPLVFYKVG